MPIIQRSKKAILGLELQLNSMQFKIDDNAKKILDEVNRAMAQEADLSGKFDKVSSDIALLNSDSTTVGSIEYKILEKMNEQSNDDVYTKSDVDNLLAGKLDVDLVISTPSSTNKVVTQTELNAKADATSVYTKEDVDSKLDGKADINSTYTKTDVDNALALKANKDDVYTKTDVDSALGTKANSSDVYTKTDIDTYLSQKLDKDNTLSEVSSTNKLVTQTELATKANAVDVYTKTEIDDSLSKKVDVALVNAAISDDNKIVTQSDIALKANSSDVYTKTDIDSALAEKANKVNIGKIGPSLKVVDESSMADGYVLSYNATDDVIEYVSISSGDGDATIDDSQVSATTTWSSNKLEDLFDTKADKDDVYTKAEVDSKAAAASYGIKYSVDDIDARDALTDVEAGDLAVVNSDRNVYQYDGENWVQFFALDGVHNHDDLYYEKAEVDTFLAAKADKEDTYTKSDVDSLVATKADSTVAGKIGPSLKTVDESNIADGYVLSFNEETGKVEYVKPTSVGIDDNNVSDNTTYSSSKIENLAGTKANATDVYTKDDVDAALAKKLDTANTLSEVSSTNKLVTETELNLKADATSVYTKTEVDNALNNKVNTSDVLTTISDDNKIVTQSDIAGKANVDDVYSKADTDSLLAGKANVDDVYNKTEIDDKMSNVLTTDEVVSAVSDDNKIVTQTELNLKADATNVYTKTEADELLGTKIDSSNTVSPVSSTNKVVTETELAAKVDKTSLKTATSDSNKIMTEYDVAAAITANNDAQPSMPMLVVDRPVMDTKSVNDNVYVFTFPLSKTPYGTVCVNDEITIYNFDGDGQSIIYEGVTLFSDKHGEITAVLASSDEEDNYKGKTIKVCYLTTDTTVAPGTDEAHPIIINAGVELEDQGDGTTTYQIDFSKGKFYSVVFDETENADGNGTDWYPVVSVVYDPTHAAHNGFNDSNDTDYEAELYLTPDDYANDEAKSTAWPGYQDEVQYIDYNWTMALEADSNDDTGMIYNLSFTRGDSVGGGAL